MQITTSQIVLIVDCFIFDNLFDSYGSEKFNLRRNCDCFLEIEEGCYCEG